MNKMTKLWLRCILLGLFGVLLSVVWPPTIAEAHNCGDFLDCYDTLRAAVSATVGLTTFAIILSVGLDFVPGVGQGKGIIEAATGRDLITGEELKTHERVLGILGPAGRIASVGSSTVRGMARGGRHADSGSDAAKGTRQADNLQVRNAHLAGKNHPVTGVPFDQRGFPVFQSRADVQLPSDLYRASDAVQFRHATQSLNQSIRSNPDLARQFTPDQLRQIDRGITPKGYTWHHHQDTGRMQLVDAKIHRQTGHTGGRSIWGGGSDYR